jgi:hypothetical protein
MLGTGGRGQVPEREEVTQPQQDRPREGLTLVSEKRGME